MKELEALDWIETVFEEHGVQLPDNELTLIRTYLTPPTQEEVCRQLSERTKLSVYYAYGKFMYHSDRHGSVLDLNELSHDDITLIGRFYQGVKEND